ncbi:hypothetical protein V500_09499 [Pseudogymnoascus sp. VKM F-4518 (FW-2643)]|nr:hypothetical protein V500_09499 [Pseudogymnoascus sp. VKM F-4518 (FW-2643)]
MDTTSSSTSSSVFESAPYIAPDLIFQVTKNYLADSNPLKVNVGAGTYRDGNGQPWVLPSVKMAKELVRDCGHEYLPIAGLNVFRESVTELIFHDTAAFREDRIATCQSLSGTGALNLAASALKKANASNGVVYITEPTWSNHELLFQSSGFQVYKLPYYKDGTFDSDAYMSALRTAIPGSAIVLHSCAHNPTGCDPTRAQWKEVASVMKERKLFPILDSAYLGFNSGSVDEDAWALKYIVHDVGLEACVALSFAKSMGLYGERIGMIAMVAKTSELARKLDSILENVQRATISSPAVYGAQIVSTVLGVPEIKKQWDADLITMSTRIQTMRQELYSELVRLQTPGDWSHIVKQSGMFGYTGISPDQIQYMQEKYHIYMADTSRISIAGLNDGNIQHFAQAIDDAGVMGDEDGGDDNEISDFRGVMGSIAMPSPGIRISIDRGGTFTDCVATIPGQDDCVVKLLSVDPDNYEDAPVEAIRRVLESANGRPYPKGQKISLQGVDSIRMGTTVATNALLERKGERTALFVTKGLKDLLHIGNQSRPKLFDLAINKPDVLYTKVIEVSERVTLEAWTESNSPVPIDAALDPSLALGVTGEIIRVIEPLDVQSTKVSLQETYDEGFRSIAICLMHSYTYRDHETAIKKLAQDIGFTHISTSSDLSPAIKIVPRGNSSTADAYLTPEIKKYIVGFESGFQDLRNSNCRCEFMQSDGGLVEFSGLSGLRAILSGPAGGVVGYAKTSYDPLQKVPIIGFDMGGTSTDVSRFSGVLEQIFESNTAGITVQSPQLDINTVAAGGGSILSWENGMFKVGPESAAAHPGPACYRKSGPLTVTDANLVLGRLRPEVFPHIFGPNENQPLDFEASRNLFQTMTEKVNEGAAVKFSLEEVASGFLDVANEAMCRPIRTLTEAKGHDANLHNLASFGGAGGQHACDVARRLGVSRVLIHKYSSVLSAYGMALADVVQEERSPSSLIYADDTKARYLSELDKLEEKAVRALLEQKIEQRNVKSERYLNMRFQGSDTALMVQMQSNEDPLESFKRIHMQQFGFLPVDRHVIIDDHRVRSIGQSVLEKPASWPKELESFKSFTRPKSESTKKVFFGCLGWCITPVYNLNSLNPGSNVSGPALITDDKQTIVVVPDSSAIILSEMVIIDMKAGTQTVISAKEVDPIQLSIFGHRFMGIAEQMGRALQKTSVSTNIKERLDFSCTIFSPDGGLVANAPHVPAMIGSMAFAVKWQIDYWGTDLSPGDVILSNAPICGGTHLPDLTVITPIFDAAGKYIMFWTASRGHHSDIGGILPGSMPPNSKELWEEGAMIEAFKVVEKGVFMEDKLCDLLKAPERIPGCKGSRCLRDNVSDIKAQAAANHRGSQLILSLVQDYGLETVQFYMEQIQCAAEISVRNMLKEIYTKTSGEPLQSIDYMDDGTAIQLKVTIEPESGAAIFDFEGTGSEVYGNWNAPISICNSAIIFALRCMVNMDIPLNQGALRPIKVLIPEASLLKPSADAAVCAGNVLTSQRIVDVIFKAFGTVAASQGCMNNLTFGSDEAENGFGYYETICGGSGGGPEWIGTSGVHTNMTNTRITDPEILERRYPVILRKFCLRHGSGGEGLHRGGDGIIRDIEFSIPIKVSILSERRAFAPYGLEGGGDGKRGRNSWVQKSGRVINLGGKNTALMKAGDRIIVETPGGGAWGSKLSDDRKEPVSIVKKAKAAFVGAASGTVGLIQSMGESA